MGHPLGPVVDIRRRPGSWTALYRPQSGALTEARARQGVFLTGASCHTGGGREEWSLWQPPVKEYEKWIVSGPHTWLVVGAGGHPWKRWLLGACSEDKGLLWTPTSKEQGPECQKQLFSTTTPKCICWKAFLPPQDPMFPCQDLGRDNCKRP